MTYRKMMHVYGKHEWEELKNSGAKWIVQASREEKAIPT